MGRDYKGRLSAYRCIYAFIFLLSACSLTSFLLYSGRCTSTPGRGQSQEWEAAGLKPNPSTSSRPTIHLLSFQEAWNHLNFPPPAGRPRRRIMRIAVFVKKWAHASRAGGLERHAFTLHLQLAKMGHQIHIFTTSPTNASSSSFSFPSLPTLYFHFSRPTAAGYLDQSTVWNQFHAENSSGAGPFDVVHTESVGLMHTRSRNITNLAVSWHGIAYETIHSDIIQELLRSPEERPAHSLTDRVPKVVEEVKFFRSYAHHVATSDHVGDVLKRVYMIPEERVHVILNGVDSEIFRPDFVAGKEFRRKIGIPDSKSLVLGIAGRLVKDKGHPLIFEALKQMIDEDAEFRESAIVLVAGDGPWGNRYRGLGPGSVIVLGPLEQSQLAKFYNAIDIFVNPTLRAQGLDHTLLEAMLCGKALLASRLASITGSVIVSDDVGYTSPPRVESFKRALYRVWSDGRQVLEKKGEVGRQRGMVLFTATKMAAAYERLFLCISSIGKGDGENQCQYKDPSW
ncbi:hypothetical protein SAY86_026272 [Trapa natans]|uniref:Glycosyltransferase subfamily 4-like N-terminal domain-containing protein n=1 Tax=Trapa natans TaxID=22666 RepID=A0AAN7QEE3_TRANT|nr:hypothetical protein SAY86_026272 [Trapa natans]